MSSSHTAIRLLSSIILCLCLAYVAGFGGYRLWDELDLGGRSDSLPVFWEAWDHVEHTFYGDLPAPRQRTYGAIRETLALLGDPYTVLVEPQSRELEQDRMRGSFGGVGVSLWRDAEGRIELSPYPDAPAQRAGVREGDFLLAVDDEPITSEMTVDDVRARIHGEVGTPITLTLSRPPTLTLDLTMEREEIQVPSVTWRALDRAPGIGYLHIQTFTDRTGQEVQDALHDLLQNMGSTGLVLDLRDNAGGLIDPAVTTASQFLSDGVVLIELRRDAQDRTFPVRTGGVAIDVPLVVVVDGGTASAAEIVAGALQDHGRAALIGETTFGKGSVQTIYDLSDGASLHLTSAIWLTPNRHRINGQGLTPDVLVPRGDGPGDEQLDRAVDYLLELPTDE
jgi:carboxyl-terminal processing protease